MTSQGCFYRACRRILRLRYLRFRRVNEGNEAGPVVYICRHRNAKGPISSLCLLPLNTLPWAFSAFMERDACVAHLESYTFPIAWKLGPLMARLLAGLLGPLFVRLLQSTGAIPVYRNSLKVRETFMKTLEALDEGSSILIFPDINYSEENGETGSLYEGFLLLEHLWMRKAGEHIRFVPVNVSLSGKTLTVGKSISFTGALPFREEKGIIARRLEDTLNQMARTYGV